MSFTGRFADRASDYAAARPSYPDAVLDVLFDGPGDPRDVLVADLGAGRGSRRDCSRSAARTSSRSSRRIDARRGRARSERRVAGRNG